MITEKQVLDLVNAAMTDDQFIVELRVDGGNKIYIEVDDRSKPIAIADCMAVSRGVEHNLDREEFDFSLEVTSPGLDRPLRVFDQYLKNVGRPVKVKDTKGKAHSGTLIEATETQITIEWREKRRIEGRKAKEWVTEQTIIPMDEVKETYIEIVF